MCSSRRRTVSSQESVCWLWLRRWLCWILWSADWRAASPAGPGGYIPGPTEPHLHPASERWKQQTTLSPAKPGGCVFRTHKYAGKYVGNDWTCWRLYIQAKIWYLKGPFAAKRCSYISPCHSSAGCSHCFYGFLLAERYPHHKRTCYCKLQQEHNHFWCVWTQNPLHPVPALQMFQQKKKSYKKHRQTKSNGEFHLRVFTHYNHDTLSHPNAAGTLRESNIMIASLVCVCGCVCLSACVYWIHDMICCWCLRLPSVTSIYKLQEVSLSFKQGCGVVREMWINGKRKI